MAGALLLPVRIRTVALDLINASEKGTEGKGPTQRGLLPQEQGKGQAFLPSCSALWPSPPLPPTPAPSHWSPPPSPTWGGVAPMPFPLMGRVLPEPIWTGYRLRGALLCRVRMPGSGKGAGRTAVLSLRRGHILHVMWAGGRAGAESHLIPDPPPLNPHADISWPGTGWGGDKAPAPYSSPPSGCRLQPWRLPNLVPQPWMPVWGSGRAEEEGESCIGGRPLSGDTIRMKALGHVGGTASMVRQSRALFRQSSALGVQAEAKSQAEGERAGGEVGPEGAPGKQSGRKEVR